MLNRVGEPAPGVRQDPFRFARGALDVAVLTASAGTLVCCALPALFVALGAGAALAGLVSAVPQLVLLSEHKALVFGLAAVLLASAAAMRWRARSVPCPADMRLAAACQRQRRAGGAVLAVALTCFAVGAFFAFVAPVLLA